MNRFSLVQLISSYLTISSSKFNYTQVMAWMLLPCQTTFTLPLLANFTYSLNTAILYNTYLVY